MKIKEIINESGIINPEVIKAQEEIVLGQFQLLDEYTVKLCQPYLSQVGGLKNALIGSVLYRGLANNDLIQSDVQYGAPYNIMPVRQDRRPRDTPFRVQSLIDDWFQKNTGYKFRSQGLFCTHKKSLALNYGWPVAVIPVGEFHYCWSPKYSDMYEELEIFAVRNSDEDPHILQVQTGKQQVQNFFDNNPTAVDQFLNIGDYNFDRGLAQGIQSGSEMMIVCKQVVFVNADWSSKLEFHLKHSAERRV